MHDIKYSFLNKNNQTIRREGFSKGEQITEKHYFSKSRGTAAPPQIHVGPPLFSTAAQKRDAKSEWGENRQLFVTSLAYLTR
jgi:hypothetical protein